MTSITKISIAICLVLASAGIFFFSVQNKDISSWNIRYKTTPPSNNSHCIGLFDVPEDVKFIYLLRRADRKNKVTKAVIEEYKDGSIILNPRHNYGPFKVLDYGPIPELNKFDLKVANSLFGAPILSKKIGSNITVNSYRFRVMNHRKNTGIPEEEAILDLRFEGSKLIQYRAQIDKVLRSDWTEV